MLPAEHHKVLANIRKAEARSKRRKLAAEQQDDSESEVEAPKAKSQRQITCPTHILTLPHAFTLFVSLETFHTLHSSSIEDILAESDSDLSEDEGKASNAQKKTGKSQKGRAWLKEGEDDEPLNFLDPKVSQRVLGKNLLLHFAKLKIVLHSLAVFVKMVFALYQPPIQL